MTIDVFRLITIHTYFFYIYAYRIFQIEFESLKSLFRLFRGKKLNPFRSRIDSYSYNIDQLFIGTLGFCIVFFLLPTVILYFIVFLILRILIVFIINIVKCLVNFCNNIPIYELSLKILKRNRYLNNDKYIYNKCENNIIKSSSKSIIIFRITTKNVSLNEILNITQAHFFIDLKLLTDFRLQ